MAESISSAVKRIKFGDFEVEFRDTIVCDPNGPQLGIQLHNLVLTSAVKYLKERGQGGNYVEIATIQAGLGRYLGYDSSDPVQFIYYESAGRIETRWDLELVSTDSDKGCMHSDEFLIKSNSGYHWKYQSSGENKNFIILEQDYIGQESCTDNWFTIDHDVKSISPVDASDMKAISSDQTQYLPPLRTKFRRISLAEKELWGGNPLELHRVLSTDNHCHAVPDCTN